MTNNDFAAYEAYERKCKAVAQLRAEILPHNKDNLFNALAAAGIILVTTEFDGSGDSGQFDEPVGFDDANTIVTVPESSITVETVNFAMETVSTELRTVHDFIETLAYELLGNEHGGWENNDGAYGEFRFDARDRTITLEYNERYIETHYHEHVF